MGDAGIVGSTGLPLLILRRCECERRGLLGTCTSSGRGGSADDGGDVGGIREKRPARSVKVSLKVVFIAGAECGGREGYPDARTVREASGAGSIWSSLCPNSSILGLGVGGSAMLGTGLWGGGEETRCDDLGLTCDGEC